MTYQLTFGKNRGKPLDEVEESYLTWMLSAAGNPKNEYHSTFRGGAKNADLWHAAQYLRSRRGDRKELELMLGKVTAVMGIDFDRPWSGEQPVDAKMVAPTEVGEISLDGSGATAHSYNVHADAINEASKHVPILKQFLNRTNQEEGFWDWLLSTMKEALKYGNRGADLQGSLVITYASMDLTCRVGSRETILVGVQPVAD